jgi:hypothetical protein
MTQHVTYDRGLLLHRPFQRALVSTILPRSHFLKAAPVSRFACSGMLSRT